MTQIHPDTRPEATGDNGQPQPPVTPPPATPDPWSQQGEPTTPVWFGQTTELPQDHAAFGLPAAGATTA